MLASLADYAWCLVHCRWSVHWFTIKFLKQQSFLNDLTLAEREQVVAIVSFAVLKTDMAVSWPPGGCIECLHWIVHSYVFNKLPPLPLRCL
jgi:hypothetical protein